MDSLGTDTGTGVLEGRRISIEGTVQGVGFRPWVYRVAHECGIAGRVRNDSSGVTIEAFAAHDALDHFVAHLRASPPPAARIRTLEWQSIPPEHTSDFVIVPSRESSERNVSIPPDLATCDDCLAEIFDPTNRRHRYPFTNCTNCGPRFTISRGVPYDRPATTMAPFRMCEACQHEYDDVADRRFHAQPNACPICGPALTLVDGDGRALEGPEREDAIARAVNALLAGRILAIKGLGGFHLACRADDDNAVATLRARKRRDEKPFAVMVRTVEEADALARLTDAEWSLLSSVERPVVLSRRRDGIPVCDGVAPGNPMIGLLLAYTPLHHLLLADAGVPLVMTSANLADEPIACENGEALARLRGIADFFLLHDREIETRCDDSVARVIAGHPVLFRRSRGYVPRAIPVADAFEVPVLATGGQMKNTFCIGVGGQAFLGPHVGDLSGAETFAAFEESAARFLKFLRVEPAILAHDLHPAYASTAWALDHAQGKRRVPVQHHHAHVVSAMAEHGLTGPVLGLAFDGTGYGPDGTAWGGEFLLATPSSYRRFATFRPIPLAGGERAIHDVWRIALAMLDDALGIQGWSLDDFPVFHGLPAREVSVVRRMIAAHVNSPRAHGVGRWFDGFAALGLGRPRAAFEGQLAMAWDFAAPAGRCIASYPFEIDRSREPWEIDLRPAVRAAAREIYGGASAGSVSGKFHETLIAASAETARLILHETARLPVVLTGGCFQNARLAEGLATEVGQWTRVYLHDGVPPGDGGLALGQAVIAAALARKEED